jgi:hypothetical protein
VSICVADAEEFVKSEDKSRIGQNSPGQAEQINAKGQEVMKMNDIGPNSFKKFAIGINETD